MGIAGVIRREFSFITGNYRILVISWIIMDLAMEMPVPNYQLYVQDVLGGRDFPLALGIIGLANFLAMAAVAFPGGYFADKYGRRWLVTTMTFGMASSFLFFAFAPSWHFILIGTIVHSLCLVYQPALFAMVQDSLPPERRGMGSSIIQMIHGTFNTPGPMIGGFLLLQFGLEWSMRIIYLVMTVLYLIAAVWRLRLKETLTNAKPIRLRYFISSYPEAIRESFNVWSVVPRTMLWLFIVQVLMMFSNSIINVINTVYAVDVLGVPKEQWWLVFIPLLLTMVVASIPVGKMVDKIGPKIPMTLGPFTLALALLLFVSGSLITLMISMCLIGMVHLFVMSSIMALSTSLVEPQNRGKVRGFINFIGFTITGVGMLLGNYFFNLAPQLPFYLTIGLTVPMTLVILFRIHEPDKQVSSQNTNL
ncbi:MAG: MFS transporter [Candidatus Bathyarchaeota archaeon]|nr:MFS transporter [Candidatus Bathyarchaeota archaeon]MDH5787567.1 MFS transporter [Candidatus Bathyarchaeota archaeon]